MTQDAATSGPVLVLEEVSRSFGRTRAVDGVSLEMARGECLVVVGPSGCGKSTLLRAVAGLTGVDGGSIRLAGREVSRPGSFVPAERRGVGIVFQDLALFPHLSVADNVGFGLRERPAKGEPGRVGEMLDLVGLSDKAGRYPHELSGGEQQRVAIARALALDPEVVLLDEPFSHLDKGLAATVRTEAIEVLRRAGASVVLVTHDQDEALAVADRVAVMDAGRLLQVDRPEVVYHRPVDERVARFLGEGEVVAGERRGGESPEAGHGPEAGQGADAGAVARTVLGSVPVTAGPDGPVRVLLRPHDLLLARGAGTGAEGGGAPSEVGGEGSAEVAGVVRRAEYRGGEVLHVVALESGELIRVVTRDDEAAAVGDAVRMRVRPGRTLAAFADDAEGGT